MINIIMNFPLKFTAQKSSRFFEIFNIISRFKIKRKKDILHFKHFLNYRGIFLPVPTCTYLYLN